MRWLDGVSPYRVVLANVFGRATLRGAVPNSTKAIYLGRLDKANHQGQQPIPPAEDSSVHNSISRSSFHLVGAGDESCGIEEVLRMFSAGGASGVSRKKPILRVCDLHFQARKIDEHDLA